MKHNIGGCTYYLETLFSPHFASSLYKNKKNKKRLEKYWTYQIATFFILMGLLLQLLIFLIRNILCKAQTLSLFLILGMFVITGC